MASSSTTPTWHLTIHSSRRRFAARLNSGVRHLVTDHRHSDRRLLFASTLIIVGGIVLLVVLGQVAATLVLPPHPLTFRVFVGAAVALLLLGSACLALRDASILWQIPLQSLAVAAIAVGVGTLIRVASDDWNLLFSSLGLRVAASLAIGTGAGWLMRRLQVRLLPRQDA